MIFFLSLIVSMTFMAILLRMHVIHEKQTEDIPEKPPVIIQITDIPQTRHRVQRPAPPKPYLTGALPVEVDDEFLPDEITIEDTNLDIDAAPASTPQVVLVPDIGAEEEEGEIYEYYAVEEPPERLNIIVPEYPEMAERAGITGTVVLKVLVNATGAVDSVEVVEGPGILHKPSIEAAKKTEFKPARHNDRAVSCWMIMPFRFTFENN